MIYIWTAARLKTVSLCFGLSEHSSTDFESRSSILLWLFGRCSWVAVAGFAVLHSVGIAEVPTLKGPGRFCGFAFQVLFPKIEKQRGRSTRREAEKPPRP